MTYIDRYSCAATDDIRRPVDGSVFFASPEESLTVTVWPLLRDVQTGVYSLIRTVVLRLVSVLAVAMRTHTHSDIHRPGRPACLPALARHVACNAGTHPPAHSQRPRPRWAAPRLLRLVSHQVAAEGGEKR